VSVVATSGQDVVNTLALNNNNNKQRRAPGALTWVKGRACPHRG
jgi:hypothetical protein